MNNEGVTPEECRYLEIIESKNLTEYKMYFRSIGEVQSFLLSDPDINSDIFYEQKSKTASEDFAGAPLEQAINYCIGGYSENYIDYDAILRAQQEAEAARLAEMRRRADEAYNRNMARIENSYNSASGNLKSNYNSTVDRLNAARDKSMGDVNSDAEKSLQEAYINNMLTRKNLNQRLSAMGYNGGATETTMGSLENQYGASRAGINEAANKSIANLNQTYGDNLAGALQSYNSAMSNLNLQRMQLENAAENARNNLEASYRPSTENLAMDQNYVNALRNVVARQGQYSFNPTQATNDYVAGNAQQAQSAAQGNNYAKYLAQAQLAAQQGKPTSTIQNELFDEVRRGNLGIDSLYDILGQLGV